MRVILTIMRVYFTSCRVEYMEKKKKLLQARDSNSGLQYSLPTVLPTQPPGALKVVLYTLFFCC